MTASLSLLAGQPATGAADDVDDAEGHPNHSYPTSTFTLLSLPLGRYICIASVPLVWFEWWWTGQQQQQQPANVYNLLLLKIVSPKKFTNGIQPQQFMTTQLIMFWVEWNGMRHRFCSSKPLSEEWYRGVFELLWEVVTFRKYILIVYVGGK